MGHLCGLMCCTPSGCTLTGLAAPVSIVLMQTAPRAWRVEVTVSGERQYVYAGKETRREALLSAVEWLELHEATGLSGRA